MDQLKKLFKNTTVRYIFFGGCTTLVNVVTCFILMGVFRIQTTVANFISISLSILFAYIVNKLFVFESKTNTRKELFMEAFQFVKMRISTMIIEVVGVILLIGVWQVNAYAAKIAIQFVVLVLNYVFSRFYVFKEKEEKVMEESPAALKLKKAKRFCLLCSFFIPIIIMAIGFAANGVYPFGDRAVLIIDSIHQYLPFFTEFRRKLIDGGSLLYTFSGGMGMDFWGLFAYYLSSPLNFLILLFSENHVMEGMAFIIVLKIGLSGGIFSYYLMERSKKVNFSVIAFSCMFALSNFMLGYYFNIMWLDSIMLLPLVMLGIERIVKGKSGKFYSVFLFLTLFCNYYIGFMVCIFACFYFLIQLIIKERQNIKNILRSCVSFGWFSLLGGGMAALVLIPAFNTLQLTKSVTGNSGFPDKLETYTSGLTTLTQHFAFINPITISDARGDLNVYCGVIVLILMILYLLDNKISKRERISKIALCAFLFVSFSVNYLNFIWHGFHMQNGLPNRFAFLYIALLLTMGFDVIQHIPKLSLKRLFPACVIPIVLTIYCFITGYGEHNMAVYIITLVFLSIYTWIIILYKIKILKKVNFQSLLLIVIVVELAVNGIAGIFSNGTVGRSSYLNSKNAFQEMMANQEDEDGFYRSEMDGVSMRNEIMYKDGNGIAVFSSTVQADVINMLRRLGMEGRTNKAGYPGATKLINDIFGIRYLASKSSADTLYQMEQVDQTDELTLYKNDDALSLGFMVDSTIYDWDIETGSHTDVQNDFIEKATGEEPLYNYKETFTVAESQSLVIHLEPNEQLYLDLEKELESITITTPYYTKTYSKYTDHLYDLGCYAEGTDVTVECTVKEDSKTSVTMSTYSYDNDDYTRIYEQLAANQIEVTSYSDNGLKGQIDVTEAGTLMFSIPYEEGWSIKVDGETVEAKEIGGTFIGLDLSVGTHTIEMTFTPSGLWLGTGISLLCIVLLIIGPKFKRKYTANKVSVAKDIEKENAGEELYMEDALY